MLALCAALSCHRSERATSNDVPEASAARKARYPSQTSDSEYEAETALAVAPSMRVALAWMTHGSASLSAMHIGYAISNDGGETFFPPGRVELTKDRQANDPALAARADGSMRLVYETFRTGINGEPYDMSIDLARLGAEGTSFDEAVHVEPAERNVALDRPQIAVTSDSTIITFGRKAGLESSIVALTSRDERSFARSTIESGAGLRELASLCVERNGPRAWVVYVRGAEKGREIAVSSSQDSGASWTKPASVSLGGEPIALVEPACAADGGRLYVAYGLGSGVEDTRKLTVLSSIHVALSSDGGRSFSARREVAAASRSILLFALTALPQGAALAAHVGAVEGAKATLELWRLSPELTVSPPEEVGATSFIAERRDRRWLGDYFALSTTGDRLWIAFADNTSGSSHVALSRANVSRPSQ